LGNNETGKRKTEGMEKRGYGKGVRAGEERMGKGERRKKGGAGRRK